MKPQTFTIMGDPTSVEFIGDVHTAMQGFIDSRKHRNFFEYCQQHYKLYVDPNWLTEEYLVSLHYSKKSDDEKHGEYHRVIETIYGSGVQNIFFAREHTDGKPYITITHRIRDGYPMTRFSGL